MEKELLFFLFSFFFKIGIHLKKKRNDFDIVFSKNRANQWNGDMAFGENDEKKRFEWIGLWEMMMKKQFGLGKTP